MTNSLMIDIGNDFTKYPGPRYRRHGRYSGEEFRETILRDKVREALDLGVKLVVKLDTISLSYLNSFLEEAFGGLIRKDGFTREQLDRVLTLHAEKPRFKKYRIMAENAITDEAARAAALPEPMHNEPAAILA